MIFNIVILMLKFGWKLKINKKRRDKMKKNRKKINIISFIACSLMITSHQAKGEVDSYYNAPTLNGPVAFAQSGLISAGLDVVESLVESPVESPTCCSSLAGVLSVTLDTNCDGLGDIDRTNNLNEDFTWTAEGFPNGGSWSQNGCEILFYDDFFTPALIWTGSYADGQISGTYAGAFNGCWWGTLDSDITETCEADSDGDGISDDLDNCVDTANPHQEDENEDGIGDACTNCSNSEQIINMEMTGIIFTRNHLIDRDLAQFKLKNMTDIESALYDVEASELTFRIGSCDDPIYSFTVPGSELNVSSRNLRYTVGKVDVVRCLFSSEQCVVNLKNTDLDNAALDALLTGDMTVSLEVGETTYTNTGEWTQYDAGSGRWTKYRKDN
ncbi:MAG: hypothetical protein D3923_00815 [Candidatus Electrothrix sp. AR3]|nr:hypothetical protein [Candidatus Electrothrix sp. AR3]